MNQLEIANLLVDTGCLSVNPSSPFTYASGLKGPIYCDNRKILSFVNERRHIVKSMIATIEEHNLKFDCLAGLATGGIPHAAWCADHLNASMVYIRSKPKAHGKQQQVEGSFSSGQKALLIEDLVNQGSSLESAVQGARKDGLDIEHCICIVDYQTPKSKDRLEQLNLSLFSLTNLDSIITMATQKLSLSHEEVEMLKKWQMDPENWLS